MPKNYNYIVLILIFFAAFLLRIWNIHGLPPSLNWDEVSHGYNAYSILSTGKDEWGNVLPVIFRAYGDYKLPVYVYLTALSELVLGVSAVAVRMPSVLSGVITILFTYLLSKRLFKNDKAALYAAFLVALEPWSLFLSRAALEANMALALIVSGIYFFISFDKNKYSLPIGIFLLGLSVWTYNSARVFVPILILLTSILYRKDLLKKFGGEKLYALISIVIGIILFVPMFLQLLNTSGQARYENVQIVDDGAIGTIVELRNSSSLPTFANKIFFNKGTFFVSQFSKNYINHFSPKFLYIAGGDNYQFNVQGAGLLYLVGAPFLIIGLWSLFKDKSKSSKFILIWLLTAPIASSLTREAPHTLRSIVMLPIPMLITAIGFQKFFEKMPKVKWLIPAIFLLVFVSFSDYLNKYMTDYRNNYSWVWQYGNEQMVNLVKSNYNDYEKFVISKKYGEPHEFLLFHWPWPPEKYQNEDKIRYAQSNWFWVDNFDKFYFVNDWDVPRVGSKFVLESGGEFDCASCLLITSEGNAPENWNKVETIYFLDGKIAYEVYEH
jgi:4-amino-4-deoxy-L-arabinose transferase-like glycosyltransferase